jgi:protein-L-isoaspartate(D-aspartate) O-methyltransferase
MSDLRQQRQFFAEEIAAVANLRTPRLIDALASIPRERFLPPGPWHVASEGSIATGSRVTPDADPRHVYHNYSIAIDPARSLFNGAPSLLAGTIDALQLTDGASVLHVGAGLGYYSAVLGHIVGPTGRVLALEVDPGLAAGASSNLEALPWVEAREANGVTIAEPFDAILVNAGVTHPQQAWLDALTLGGRLIVPLTAVIPAMGPLGKGVMALVTNTGTMDWGARVLTFVAIYSAVGLRDDDLNTQLGQALMKTPFPRLTRLRRDAHERESACWLHAPRACLSQG